MLGAEVVEAAALPCWATAGHDAQAISAAARHGWGNEIKSEFRMKIPVSSRLEWRLRGGLPVRHGETIASRLPVCCQSLSYIGKRIAFNTMCYAATQQK
ncbi:MULTISPECIES: hypothetical protein [Cupriavidus]|uniref:hypothetical protein n=1 Tax=Cupriavidus TaxID=106589 RepID=UPI001E425084|nr:MULTISPECIES: hypothetical protein [Cupriavidus]MCD9120971.1 hypothetical protein [Cupriavidus sp. UGS-1]